MILSADKINVCRVPLKRGLDEAGGICIEGGTVWSSDLEQKGGTTTASSTISRGQRD